MGTSGTSWASVGYKPTKMGMNRMVVHLSIDSTTIAAREKPLHKEREKEKEAPSAPVSAKKRGPKKGSPEEKEFLERKTEEKWKKLEYLEESPEKSLSELEMRCSMTARLRSR